MLDNENEMVFDDLYSKTKSVLISIIIPVYNAASTIERCVQSVVSEAEICTEDYEVILVDDGSIDSSAEICTRLVKENERIRLVSQQNAGPSVARNRGIELAHGALIALNDADDRWLPGKLKIQIEELQKNPGVDLVCAKYGTSLRAGKRTVITYRKEVFHNFFSPQTSVFRAKALVGGFPENQRHSEDMRFLLDFMRTGTCLYMPFLATVPVSGKRVWGDSGLSAHLWKMERGELGNIVYAWQLGKIHFVIMVLACLWSLAKFFRRAIVSAIIRIKNARQEINLKKVKNEKSI